MTPGAMLYFLNMGKRLTRVGWNGKGMYVQLQTPDEGSKMSLPYIYMCTVKGDLVPWVASHTDLLTDDWYDVDKYEALITEGNV